MCGVSSSAAGPSGCRPDGGTSRALNTLRQHRKAAGWSLRKFAELTAYDFGYLGQIELGDRPTNALVVAAYDRVRRAD
ncbi:helix-turn-helix domain-containing protein [Micromonospora sp. DT228]|uniref:helix-turn-helix domain-containing protein n=1 Tax=Micromonospora sp. DT228 TaxID=3393443 RepID=UPI003CE944AE